MKGMMHTPFALLAVVVLMMLFLVPLNSISSQAQQDLKTVESSNAYLNSIETAFKDALGISASNYVASANEYIVNNGFVSDAGSAIEFPESKFNGNEITYTNYSELLSGIKENEVGVLDYDFSGQDFDQGLKIDAEANLRYNFTHNISGIKYSHDSNIESLGRLKGPDPLLENASSGNAAINYTYCGFDMPAELLGTGDSNSGHVAHGYAAVKPDSISDLDSQGKILILENASGYTSSDLEDFNGVITEKGSITNGDYAEVEGLKPNVSDGSSLIINEAQVWRSHFREILDENCYVKNSNAPGLFNRMEGSFSSEDNGVTTFTSESNSTQPNEAYLFYDNSSPALTEISGVSKGDYVSDLRSDFAISQSNRDEWNLEDIS